MFEGKLNFRWALAALALCLMVVFAVNSTGQVAAHAAHGGDVCSEPGYFDGPWDEEKARQYEECQQQGQGNSGDDCVIPESGPWPPCATGGNGGNSGNNGNSGDDCVIPESGPWPPCATGGNGGGSSGGDSGNSGDDCVIPESGPWPPCATDGSGNGGGTAPAPAPEPVQPVFDEAAVEARIDVAIEELQTYWQEELKKQGVNYRPPGIVETYRGDPNDPPNAFYIPAMDAIFIDLRLLEEITADYGMYAAVAVLAHEWGHFIQDQLDLYDKLPGLRQIELQADCVTGSFTTSLAGQGRVTPNDIELARQLFFSIGDDQINPDAPYDHPGAHGTGEERMAAFDLGLNTDANTCINGFRADLGTGLALIPNEHYYVG